MAHEDDRAAGDRGGAAGCSPVAGSTTAAAAIQKQVGNPVVGQGLLRRADGRAEYADLTNVPAADREWRLEELVSTTHLNMAVRLGSERPAGSFRASVRRRWIDDLTLLDVECDPCSGMRGQRRAAKTDALYLGVMVVRRGSESVTVGNTVADVGPGDVVVWRSDQPARFQVHESQVKQTLIVPMSALTEVSGRRDGFGPLRFDCRAPSTQLFTGYLDLLSRTMDQLTAQALSAARSAALELFAAAARQHCGGPDGSAPPTPLAVMTAWIDERLSDGSVTPEAIATAHCMSVRSVYRVFEEAGETVSGFVRSRRLARARREVAAGAEPISDIAMRWGFSDASHFTRAFRAQYGSTPRDYRGQLAVRR